MAYGGSMSRLSQRMTGIIFIIVLILSLANSSNQHILAQTPNEPARTSTSTDETRQRYIVHLQGQALIPFASSLLKKGQKDQALNLQQSAVQIQRSTLQRNRQQALHTFQNTVGRNLPIIAEFDTSLHAIALELTPIEARRIQKLNPVLAVYPEQIHHIDTDFGPHWIGANQIHTGESSGIYVASLLASNLTPPTNSSLTGQARLVWQNNTQELQVNIKLSGSSSAAQLIRLSDNAILGSLTPQGNNYGGTWSLSSSDSALLSNQGLQIRIMSSTHPQGAIAGTINGYQGEGIVVGVIDTGINMLHPSFAELGGDGYQHINPFGQGNFIGACNPNNPYYQASIVCNNKLIGAWTFPTTASVANINTGAPSPHDDDGHGSHTASTIAGNVLNQVPYGNVNYAPVSGVAPHANIIAYDVCGFMDGFFYDPDCPTIPILQAIEQATLDQVDVINFSISGGVAPWDDPIELAFLSARQAGIVVVTSAGNEGPDTSSVNHVSPWLLSVAAATHDRQIQKRLTNIHTSSQTYSEIIGRGNSVPLPSDTEIVYGGQLSPANPTCNPFNASQAQQIAGKIVLCNFSSTFQSRVTKAQSVLSAGGAGIILANLSPVPDELPSESYPLPAIEIYQADGENLRTLLNTLGEPLLASISSTEQISQPSNADIVADFSSRGPAPKGYADIIKPDLTAPGVAILAAVADNGDSTADFDFYNGTSMASPHVAGSVALLAGLHPDWTVGEIQSALMLTASPTLTNEDTSIANAFDRGSGRVRVDAAALAGLVLDESIENFQQANPALGGQASTLNLASLAQQKCILQCMWTRTFRNTQAEPITWTASSDNPDLSISPSSFTIAANAQQTVTFTLDVSAQALGSYIHRQVTLQSNNSKLPDLHLPVVALSAGSSQQSAYIYERTNPNFSMQHNVKTLPVTSLGYQIAGLVQGSNTQGNLQEDAYHRLSITVPANTDRLVADLRSTSSPDMDIYVMYDANNNGNLDINDKLVCMSATIGSKEYCTIDQPSSGKYFIDIENYEASSASGDSYLFTWAIVPNSNNNNLQLNQPSSNPTGTQLTLTEQFNIPSTVGQSWYGSYQLLDLTNNSTLGRTNIDFHHVTTADNQLTILSGNQQSAIINQAFADKLNLRLTDSTGNPLMGHTVTFSAPNSGASAIFPSGNSQITNHNGVVSVPVRANNLVGSYQIIAEVAGLNASFQLSNQFGPLAKLTIVSGNNQTTQLGQAFSQLLQVQASDQYDNPLPNITINFSAPASGASAVLSANSATTNANGIASINISANTIAGSYSVLASSSGHTVEFILNNQTSPTPPPTQAPTPLPSPTPNPDTTYITYLPFIIK
jgi:subtilisin family serine protease